MVPAVENAGSSCSVKTKDLSKHSHCKEHKLKLNSDWSIEELKRDTARDIEETDTDRQREAGRRQEIELQRTATQQGQTDGDGERESKTNIGCLGT